MIRVTVIVDNRAMRAGLATEHGLAFWIESGAHRVLFDTGAGGALRPNAAALGADLAAANAIALSHGHYDHTGGLVEAWTQPASTALFLHPAALAERYRVSDNGCKVLSMPRPARELTAQHTGALRFTTQPTEVAPNVWLTGCIARRHKMETAHLEPFFLDPSGCVRDTIMDDQALYVVTATGTVVLLGCAHAGVVTTLECIRELTGNAPLRAVIGGMHLRNATPETLAWTIAQLKALDPAMVAPLHCTGEAAARVLAAAFGDRFRAAGAGSLFEFTNHTQPNQEKESTSC